MKKLTAKQIDVLNFIRMFIAENSYPPTIRQVADNYGISVKGAYDHIKALEKKGKLKLKSHKSRTMELIEDLPENTPDFVSVPILGYVAAGTPIFSEEVYEGSCSLPASMLKTGNHFILEVRGDSMINAGIREGDMAVFQYRQQADNGDIVVARLDEAFTLKRFYKERNRIRLQAENDNYAPIYSQNVQIVGKLVTLFRQY